MSLGNDKKVNTNKKATQRPFLSFHHAVSTIHRCAVLCSDEKMSAAISITIFLSVIFGLGSPYVTGWLMVESVAALMQTKFNIF